MAHGLRIFPKTAYCVWVCFLQLFFFLFHFLCIPFVIGGFKSRVSTCLLSVYFQLFIFHFLYIPFIIWRVVNFECYVFVCLYIFLVFFSVYLSVFFFVYLHCRFFRQMYIFGTTHSYYVHISLSEYQGPLHVKLPLHYQSILF